MSLLLNLWLSIGVNISHPDGAVTVLQTMWSWELHAVSCTVSVCSPSQMQVFLQLAIVFDPQSGVNSSASRHSFDTLCNTGFVFATTALL